MAKQTRNDSERAPAATQTHLYFPPAENSPPITLKSEMLAAVALLLKVEESGNDETAGSKA